MKAKLIVAAIFVFAAALSGAQGHGSSHGFRFQGSDGGSMVQLAERPDVQKELALTDDQKAKIADLEMRLQAAVKQDFDDMKTKDVEDPNVMRSTVGGTGDKFAEELPNILNAGQVKRLRELLIQRAGYASIERKDVQDDLGLSDDQRAKIKDAQAAMLKAFDGLQTSGEQDPKKLQQMATDAINARNAAIVGVLTEDQKATFEKLKGTPFTFENEA